MTAPAASGEAGQREAGPDADVEGVDPEVVELVERAQAGDSEAFAQLYDRYLDIVYGFVYRRIGHRETTEDLVGDVFMRAWRRLDTFSWQGVDVVAWIITIARNRVYDHYKAASSRYETPVDVAPDSAAVEAPDDPERVATSRDMATRLGEALNQLKDSHREVIELRFVHNLSVAETAEAMDRTVGASKALQYRALRALAREISDEPGLAEIAAAGLGSLVAALGGMLG